MHYDEVHLKRWREKRGAADSKYRLNQKVVNCYFGTRHEQLHLPASVKEILQKPADEDRWPNLELLRRAILDEVEGTRLVQLETGATIDQVADAIDGNEASGHEGIVGTDITDPYNDGIVLIPAGAQVKAKLPPMRSKAKVAKRKQYAAAVRQLSRPETGGALRVRTRPLGTALAMDLDDMGKTMVAAAGPAKRIAAAWAPVPLSEFQMLDKMLLVLWDALILSSSERWTARGVANLRHERTHLLAQCFLRGQAVGKRPLHDGMCACCGALLHGVQNDHSSLSNKCNGPPIDVRGQILVTDGVEATEAQPPFLLSYSPRLFAREVPAVFEHDPETNRLFLAPDMPKPWVRPSHGRQKDGERTWLYCGECRDRYVPQDRSKKHGHVPFRDKAAQANVKPEYRRERCGKDPLDIEAPSLGKPEAQEAPTTDGAEDEEAVGALAALADALAQEEAQGQDDNAEALVDSELASLQATVDWTPFPSLEEYRQKWEAEKAKHIKAVVGEFGRENLVPEPNPLLMQDVPWVPFDQLRSEDAQARLSVCRPLSGLQEAQVVGGVPTYAHNTGEVNFRRRNPLQVAATFACVLNRRDGAFMGLGRDELEAWHECLCWLREPGNNRVLRLYGTQYEKLVAACKVLEQTLRSRGVLLEGHQRAKIRFRKQFGHDVKEGTLGETLGQDRAGIVVVDASCHPMTHKGVSEAKSIVATQEYRIDVHLPRPDGRGWCDEAHSLDTETCPELGQTWREDLASGAKFLAEETWVPANDPHYDAKCWPVSHPYGTGSLLSEYGSGGTQRLARNRLALPQSWFRRSSSWAFWMLDRLHKTALFFKERNRKKQGRANSADPQDPDPFNRLFGTAEPSKLPETTEWWKRQQRDLFAASENAELGPMGTLTTITHNDSTPEMLAAIRRGPMAGPTRAEMVEYLVGAWDKAADRPEFQDYAYEHVLSFQRRVHAAKQHFMQRNKATPRGILEDWWDRTEAQARGALHAHILEWWRRRCPADFPGYRPIAPVPRTAPGNEPKQRPAAVAPVKVTPYQEDALYYHAHVARVNAEMVRPFVGTLEDGTARGGFDVAKMRIAGLARTIQSRLYMHSCSPKYCMLNRSSCRFFFPWPEQCQQQYDENTDRVALQRRYPADDRWVVPHDLELAMFSPSTINVVPFDPHRNVDQAKAYAGKYVAKAEKWFYLETFQAGGSKVKEFLKARTVGLCQVINRLLNFHVVRFTRPVKYSPTVFVPDASSRGLRDAKHLESHPEYPDPICYLDATQLYFFRHADLSHLRLHQYKRYFAGTKEAAEEAQAPTREDTRMEEESREDHRVPVRKDHRHYDEMAQALVPGATFESRSAYGEKAVRRRNAALAVNRAWDIEPLGDRRESFYEQQLLLGLPWHCPELRPAMGPGIFSLDGEARYAWRFVSVPPTSADVGETVAPVELLLGRHRPMSMEAKCSELERLYHDFACACCAKELPSVCANCVHAVGFHQCVNPDGHRLHRWRCGTLHGGRMDVERALYRLSKKGLDLENLRAKAVEYVEAGHLSAEQANSLLQHVEAERKVRREVNDAIGGDAAAGAPGPPTGSGPAPLTRAQLIAKLEEMENNMREGGTPGVETDQWRVYKLIIHQLEHGPYLRLMIQAVR